MSQDLLLVVLCSFFSLIFSLYTPAKLWLVLGEDNCVKLTLSSGILHSVDSLKYDIREHCGIEGEFRLRYMDIDFDQFFNLTSTEDIQDKRTVKVIIPSEQGSVTSYYVRKISLKCKMGNYRTKLRGLGCPEISINSLKNRKPGNSFSPNQVKVRTALVTQLEKTKRVVRRSEWNCYLRSRKRNNHQVIKEKMEETFAHRQYEVVQDMPFITEFKSRWPALFKEHEASLEFAGHK